MRSFLTVSLALMAFLFILIVDGFGCYCSAFQPPVVTVTTRSLSSSVSMEGNRSVPTGKSSTGLNLVNKKQKEPEPVVEKEKREGLDLFFLYMTPWRNPNSLFVYIFVILYCLGKYSEAQSIARSAAGM